MVTERMLVGGTALEMLSEHFQEFHAMDLIVTDVGQPDVGKGGTHPLKGVVSRLVRIQWILDMTLF